MRIARSIIGMGLAMCATAAVAADLSDSNDIVGVDQETTFSSQIEAMLRIGWSGSQVDGNLTDVNASPTVTVDSGAVLIRTTEIYHGATVVKSSGSSNGFDLRDTATLQVDGGTDSGYSFARGNSTVIVAGGAFGDLEVVGDDATVSITGGVTNWIGHSSGSCFAMTGGQVNTLDWVRWTGATCEPAVIQGGTVSHSLTGLDVRSGLVAYLDASKVGMVLSCDGHVQTANLDYGTTSRVLGGILDEAIISSNSPLEILAGTVGDIDLGVGSLLVRGGRVNSLLMHGGVATLRGASFEVTTDGQDWWAISEGTYGSGSTLDGVLGIRDTEGLWTVGVTFWSDTMDGGSIVLESIPVPGPAAVASVVAAGLCRRRRR